MGNNRYISVQKIAEIAGTSPATVSRVINQNGRFSKETEARVRQVMEELNYQPNRLARSLRMQRSWLIGILVPDITNDFFSRVTKEIQHNLFQKGNMTIICNTDENVKQEEEQVRMLLEQQVDGIIFVGGRGRSADIPVPAIFIDRDPHAIEANEKPDYVFIESDNEEGGCLAGQTLLSQGVTRPAFVCFGKELSTIQGRLKGFLKAIGEKDPEKADMIFRQDAPYFVETHGDTLSEGERAAAFLLGQEERPDGVFFTSDMLAIGGTRYFTRHGIKVPEQMKVVGFDGIAMGDVTTPGLTSVEQDMDKIGSLAAARILDMINHKTIRKKKIRVPVRLITRGSA